MIFTEEEFLALEIEVAQILSFRLRAPTVNSWSNRLAVQWDLYVDSVECDPTFKAIRFKAADSEVTIL